MGWRCPLCQKKESLIPWRSMSDTYYATHPGGATCVCNKCEKNRAEEIARRNLIMGQGASTRKKDPECDHEWAHGALTRWVCLKCHAEYNWLCGHGGSMYACQKCYDEHVAMMISEEGSVEAYLAKHSW